jgi:hypothetical protein
MTAKNVSASVRQRLLNLAKASGTDYNQLLIRHAIERLLFRLASSPHAKSFVLKGAMLFAVWRGSPHRPTQDLDLLGFGDPSAGRLIRVFKDLCGLKVEDDGWTFDPESVTADPIRAIDEYGGMRVHLIAKLGSAIVRMQTDIGFGDAITPASIDADYPVLIGQPAPRLKAYPAATVVAEKAEAIAKLGMLNTRFKDYYDLNFLADHFEFEGDQIVRALQATFARRGTELPERLPTGLTSTFADDSIKQQQWSAFSRRVGGSPRTLPEIIAVVAAFLERPLQAAAEGSASPFHWRPPGPWI